MKESHLHSEWQSEKRESSSLEEIRGTGAASETLVSEDILHERIQFLLFRPVQFS
jgi:hypothetical protein